MAKLTLAQFRSEVALACRNMDTSDLYYGTAAEMIDRFINRARNKIVRMVIGPRGAVNKFPELRKDWTIGPTVAGSNTIARPTDCLALDRLMKQEDDTVPTGGPPPLGNWAAIDEQIVAPMDEAQFVNLSKSTATGYAQLWLRQGDYITYYPTTTAAYVDYFHGYGVRFEVAAASSSAFAADEYWDDVTVMMAAAMIQERRGWFARSRELYARVQEELENVTDTSALEGLGKSDVITIQGAPNRASVYGR